MAERRFDRRTIIKGTATIASALWMSITCYQEFFDADPTNYGFHAPEVEARMKGCTGSFQQRYDCKEAIIIAKGHDSFVLWMEKVSLILGPPLLLMYVIDRANRPKQNPRRPRRGVRPPEALSKRRVR